MKFCFLYFILLALGSVSYYIIIYFNKLKPSKTANSSTKDIQLGWGAYFALILAGIFLVCTPLAAWFFTRPENYKAYGLNTSTGVVGDTIGGITNPLIAMAGVIITGLAFYIQYKANQQQRDFFIQEQNDNKKDFQDQLDNQNLQLRYQQFDSRFYEMLRLHRENITELQIDGYDFNDRVRWLKIGRTIQGRKVFVVIHKELEIILRIYKKLKGTLNDEGIKRCYFLFFSGLDLFKKKYPDESEFTAQLYEARKRHQYPEECDIKVDNSERKRFDDKISLDFNFKPFSGHASNLGHYFRHLFLAVKSIVYSDTIVEYPEKMKYLKLLRAQLSNHEQILLFYNWLGHHGEPWENHENKFFTEYCMIHNLWHDQILQDNFIQGKVDTLRKSATQFREGPMYEID